MNRSTQDRGGSSSEPPRRKTPQQDRLSRWTDKVFVIPSQVAGVIAKMKGGKGSLFGHAEPPKVDTPAPRRHRGFYVWRPTVGPDGKPYALGAMFRLIEEIDPRTGEIVTPKKKDIS
jgi:hypothetical protein